MSYQGTPAGAWLPPASRPEQRDASRRHVLHATAAGLDFACWWPKGVPERITADAGRVRDAASVVPVLRHRLDTPADRLARPTTGRTIGTNSGTEPGTRSGTGTM
jgi:hypothetical protein